MGNPHADLIARLEAGVTHPVFGVAVQEAIAYLSAPVTLAQAMTCPEVQAMVGAAKEVWDQACANHDNPPPVKYMAPYGGLAKLHSALAPFFGELYT